MKAFYLIRRSNTWSRCKKQSLICNSLSGKDRTSLTPNLKHYIFCHVCHFALKRSTLGGCVYLLHECHFLLMKVLLLLFVCRELLFVCMLFGIGGLLLDFPLAFMSIEYMLLTSTFLHTFPLHIFSGCSCMRGHFAWMYVSTTTLIEPQICIHNKFSWCQWILLALRERENKSKMPNAWSSTTKCKWAGKQSTFKAQC